MNRSLILLTGALMIGAAPAAFAQGSAGTSGTTGTTTGTVPAPSAIQGSVDSPHRTTTPRVGTGSDAGAITAPGDASRGDTTRRATSSGEIDPDPSVVGTTPSITSGTQETPTGTSIDTGGSPGTTIIGADTDPVDVAPGLTTDSAAADPGATTGTTGAGDIGMSADQVRQELEAQGLEDIEDLKGPFFTATAQLNGEEIEVRVDAMTGEILEPDSLQE